MLGVGLRVTQWVGNPSLWLDELMLVRNILDRSMAELVFRGLDHGQVAPIGYLFPTKAVTLAFGDGEMALRAVPLGASILALVLFWRLARSLLQPVGTLVSTTAFALNPLLISLAAVVKPYATDVLGCVLLLIAFHYLREPEGSLRRRIMAGAGAGAVGFLSIPSVIVACAALSALLCHSWAAGGLRGREPAARTLSPLVAWGTTALAGALWARALVISDVGDRTEYWTQAGGFAPPFIEYPTWVLNRWTDTVLPELLFRPYIGEAGAVGAFLVPHLGSVLGWAILVSGLGLSVAALLILRGSVWAVATLLPFAIALGLARIEMYPMDGRTSVFLLPLILLLIGALISWLEVIRSRAAPWLARGVAALLALCFAVILIDHPPVYVVKHDREVIRELSERRAPAEPTFAHPWAHFSFTYYGPRFGVESGVVFGGNANALREDLDRLDAFRGEPSLWVLFTHSYNRDLVLCYLDELGTELERLVLPGGMPRNPASLHRYDLSDDTRWPSVDSAAATLTTQAFEGDPPRCRRRQWR